MVEENNTFPKGEGEHDLYIGVRNDLSPFYVDLEALTRGLVIVGQSGCGKSFLIGRLVEEIVRKTTEKTRILIIDSNSDFCEGLELKGNEIFERQSLDYYKSGILKNREFDTFKEKEMQYFNTLKSSSGLPIGQLYGREKPFNLSWEWLVTDVNRFIQIVKANTSSIGYYFALCYLESNIVDGCKDSCGEWAKAAIELSDLRSGHLVAPIYLKFGKHIAPKGFDVGDCLELCNDIRKEIKGGVWRKNPKSEGFPESVFSDSRVNFIEIEKIIDKKSRLKVVACFLIHCLDVHRNLTEKYRDSWTKENSKSITEAEQYLKHTFILIDEAQNYAPEETNDPHEKMLGELIHTGLHP